MRRSPRTGHRIDHLTRLVDHLLDGLAAQGEPVPTAPQIRAALRDLRRKGPRRSRRSTRR